MQRDIYTFTVNLKSLIRIALNDPQARVEILEAINEGPLAHTEKLGAANLKDGEGSPDSWYTVFAGTSREVGPGQPGFLLRNQAGDRISMRLRSQRKDHAATVDSTVAGGGAELLQRAMGGEAEAARVLLKLAELQNSAPKETAEVESVEVEQQSVPEEAVSSPFETEESTETSSQESQESVLFEELPPFVF